MQITAEYCGLKLYVESREPFQQRIRSVPTKAGDLLIWHKLCPYVTHFSRVRALHSCRLAVTCECCV